MLRIALVGHGRWGSAIARTLGAFPDVATTIVKRGEKIPVDMDGVVIATPISTHKSLALPLIKAGIPVFIEKPLTDSIRDAEVLIATAKKSKSLVHVGHIHLHNPAFKKVTEIVPSLGPIRYLAFEGLNNGPFRNDASVLWDWLPHPLSMALTIMKSKPIRVQAWGLDSLRPRSGLYDIGLIRYDFKKGVSLVCTVNWLSPEKSTTLTIVGKKSSLVYEGTLPPKVSLYEGMGPLVKGREVTHQVPQVLNPEFKSEMPLEIELRAFIAAIENKSRNNSDLQFGATIVSLIAAAHTSIQKGGRAVKCS